MAKYKFKVVAGSHFEGDQEYTKNAVISTDRRLDLIFPNKFQRVGGSSFAEADGEDAPEDAEDPVEPAKPVDDRLKEAEPEYGTDVTNKFALAEEKEVLVFARKAGGRKLHYFVFDVAAPTIVLNEDRLLTTPAEVNSFLEKEI